jgi:hypothetical protein
VQFHCGDDNDGYSNTNLVSCEQQHQQHTMPSPADQQQLFQLSFVIMHLAIAAVPERGWKPFTGPLCCQHSFNLSCAIANLQ